MCTKFEASSAPFETVLFNAAIAELIEGEITVFVKTTTLPFFLAISFNLEEISVSTSDQFFKSFPLYGPVKRALSYNGKTEAKI